jgi:plastocyanin
MVAFKQTRWAALKRFGLVAVIGVAIPALVACGGGSSGSGGGSTASGNRVTMTADKFVPETITVKAGEQIIFENTSSVQHSVTLDKSKVANPNLVELPSGVAPSDSGFLDPKKTYTLTLTVPGTYKYVCVPHEAQGMVGTIIVQ